MYSRFVRKTGQRERSPTTKNCAPQTTAICGSGERQPPRVQWMASARGSLLSDQGIPSASRRVWTCHLYALHRLYGHALGRQTPQSRVASATPPSYRQTIEHLTPAALIRTI
ncbi:hypothetical protein TNIN_292831 [Trichonephila inaurata madagascariensis]|uniref:Uncharacterized protein n=1 Tax=Trichonephila inaurata madagascariensis TaxID=2747483 RepID=A0A8X6WSZ2_9ARAC|nr:hypothetical protein TNIN_292831 [Trichonephila inaurata madagascariensis]